ncbi:MAG: methyl-accepting chemotaxis protein [Desulfobacteraceae bacterium]|jgi:NitT/TauT family transport system substrate-binding protein
MKAMNLPVMIVVWAILGLFLLLVTVIPWMPLKFITLMIAGAGISYAAVSQCQNRFFPKKQLPLVMEALSGDKDLSAFQGLNGQTRSDLKHLYAENVRKEIDRAIDALEAERPPVVLQNNIWDGILRAFAGDADGADRILGPGIAGKIKNEVDAVIASETSKLRQTGVSMDSEFSLMENLSGELEHCVQSMYASSRNAAKANRIAFEARDIASHSNETVAQLVDSITSISRNSEKIKNIAESINAIAYRTNLLALNASIEAARAGEAGKGFNVVAMEVKELAGQAKSDANETQELIDIMTRQISTADQQVRQSADAFASLADKSHETGTLIEQLQESSLSGSHDMDRAHIGLLQSSVSVKRKWKASHEIQGLAGSAPELLLPKTYKIQTQWYPQAQFAGYYVAFENGYYKDAGLNVEIVDGGPETNPILSLIRGEFSFITAWLSSTITTLNRGADIALLSQIFQKSGLTLVALKESGIHSIRNLKQKTISSWGGIFEYPIQAMNLDHELDMEILDYGADMKKVRDGEIDVIAVMSYNELLGIYDSGISEEELSLIRMSDVGYNFPEDGLYTCRSLLQDDEAACRQFAEASIRGWMAARQDKEMALECTMRHHQRSPMKTSKGFQKRMLDEVCRLIDSQDANLGHLRTGGYDQTQQALKRFGMIKSTVDISNFYANLHSN